MWRLTTFVDAKVIPLTQCEWLWKNPVRVRRTNDGTSIRQARCTTCSYCVPRRSPSAASRMHSLRSSCPRPAQSDDDAALSDVAGELSRDSGPCYGASADREDGARSWNGVCVPMPGTRVTATAMPAVKTGTPFMSAEGRYAAREKYPDETMDPAGAFYPNTRSKIRSTDRRCSAGSIAASSSAGLTIRATSGSASRLARNDLPSAVPSRVQVAIAQPCTIR